MKKFQFLLLFSFLVFNVSAIEYEYFSIYKEIFDCSKSVTCGPSINSIIVDMIDNYRESTYNACKSFYMHSNGGILGSPENDHYPIVLENKFWNAVLNDTVPIDGKLKEVLTFLNESYYNFCKEEQIENVPVSLKELNDATNITWQQAFHTDEWSLSLMSALGELRKIGLNDVFFHEHVTVAADDADRLLIELNLPRERKEFIPSRYYLYKYFNATDDQIIFNQSFTDSFEKFLTKLDRLNDAHRIDINLGEKVETKIFTLAELKKNISSIDWDSYFSAIFERPIANESFAIQIRNPAYFRELSALLEETNKKVSTVYVIISFIENFIDIYRTYAPLRSKNQAHRCGLETRQNFEMLLNYLHWHFVFADIEINIGHLENMFEELKLQFSKQLQKHKFKLNSKELQFVQNKLEGMKLRIGNTPLQHTPEFYADYFKGLRISNISQWINNREGRRVNIARQHERIFKTQFPEDAEYFYGLDDSRGLLFEPYYVPQRNTLVIPQPFLEVPYFSQYLDELFQFASSAFGIARAIIEAFTPASLIYDAEGRESDIGYDIIRKSEYQKALDCFKSAEMEDKWAIMDISGLRLVLDIYYNQIPTEGYEAQLDTSYKRGIKKRELFFFYYAQYFAGREGLNTFWRREGDEYEKRLNAAVYHTKEFAEVFNCTEKPIKTCDFW